MSNPVFCDKIRKIINLPSVELAESAVKNKTRLCDRLYAQIDRTMAERYAFFYTFTKVG